MLKVSCGISAYNEEKNIRNILCDILSQKQVSWKLEEVLVYCEKGTDSTAAAAESLKDSRIKVVEYPDRRGKTFRVSQMCEVFAGDILVVLDADLKLKDTEVVENLVQPFLKDGRVMLTGGNTQPFAPKTFFEKAVYSTFKVFEQSRRFVKNGDNIFGCNGGCLAVRKELVKDLKFPQVINEDDFLYFTCLSKGFLFKHAPEAVVYYKLPSSLSDYLKQNFRSNPSAVKVNFKSYFGSLVEKEYYRPVKFLARAVFKEFLHNPLGVAYMTAVNILCKPFFPLISRKYKLSWYTAESTK